MNDTRFGIVRVWKEVAGDLMQKNEEKIYTVIRLFDLLI